MPGIIRLKAKDAVPGSGQVSIADTDGVLSLVLPWPPSINHYWRRVGNRTLISAEGRAYRELLVAYLFGVRKFSGDISVSIVAHPPDARRRDIDNILKSLLDALQHAGVYRDDNQIVQLKIVRMAKCVGGKVIVVVSGA